MLVHRNRASPGTPGLVADTRNVPSVSSAVNVEGVAVPSRAVVTVSGLAAANVPEGGVAGGANVTSRPPAPLPHWSDTVATNGAG